MANNLTLASPEIQATIKMLRKKAGLDKDPEKTAKDYEREIALLNKRIDALEKIEEKKEAAYWRESDRIEAFLRMLTEIHNPELKKAVSLIVYWDKFSWLSCDIIERMRKSNERLRVFLDMPRQFGYISAMNKFVGTKEFAEAMKLFGYGDAAEERVKDKSRKSKAKSKKSTKKSTSKKGSK